MHEENVMEYFVASREGRGFVEIASGQFYSADCIASTSNLFSAETRRLAMT